MTYGPVAVVTGASDGIGRALAIELAREGYALGLIARRRLELEIVASDIQDAGGAAVVAAADVTNRRVLLEAIRHIESELGPTDLLVANAAISRPACSFVPDAQLLEEELAVNVVGAAAAMEAVVPGMAERGRGHVVAISSVAAWRGLPGSAGYCASKAALTTLMESYRTDWHSTGITTTTVHPGFVDTPLIANETHPKPFLMSADKAARIIAKAIRRKRKRCDFPKRMVWTMRVVRLLPDAVLRWANQRTR